VNSSFEISDKRPFACAVSTAVQTVKAELDDRPAAIGTCESINIFNPLGFLTFSAHSGFKERIALYPHKK
jgi:hypothetical protein